MDDVIEIDIKKYIRKILSKWKWILGVTLIAGLAIFLFFYTKADVYKAKAVLVISKPRYEVRLGSDITTSVFAVPSEEFISNAVHSGGILSTLFSEWDDPKKGTVDLDQFVANNLEVSIEGKGTVIVLSVKSASPEESAKLANLWAELAAAQINLSYYGIDPNQVQNFTDQLDNARLVRENTGNALVEFSKTDQTEFLLIKQQNLNARVADAFQRKQVLEAAEFDVLGMLDYLEDYSPDELARQGDLLNFTLIQTRVYGSPVAGGLASSPNQLQLVYQSSTESLTNQEFIDILKTWVKVLQSSIQELEEQSTSLISEVTALQAQIKDIGKRRGFLETDFTLSDSTYTTLRTKVEEVLLNDQTSSGNAKLLSEASVSTQPLPHNTVTNTIIAMVGSALLSIIVVLISDWWRTEEESAEDTKA